MTESTIIAPILIDEKEAARALGISTRHLRKYDIPTVRLGRRKLYDPKDLKAFKDQMKWQHSTGGVTKTVRSRKSGQLISGSTVVSFQEALAAGRSEKPKPAPQRSSKRSSQRSKDKILA